MGSRVTVVLAVVLLVVVAGCSAFTGGGSDPPDRETVTPVPITNSVTETPTVAGDPPPGVFANGTVDVDRLVAAHERQVANRSYTWEFQYSVDDEEDSPFTEGFTRRVEVGADAFTVEVTDQGMSPNISLYADDVGYLRTVQNNWTEYERVSDPSDHGYYAFTDEVLRRYLIGVDVDVSVVQRGGQTYYRLYSSDFDVPEPLDRFNADVWNYSATLYVTPEGFVRSMAVDFDRDGRTGDERVTARFDYSALDETTVSEPDWVSRVTPTPTPMPETTADSTTTPPAAGPTTASPTADQTTTPPTAGPTTTPPTAEPTTTVPTASPTAVPTATSSATPAGNETGTPTG